MPTDPIRYEPGLERPEPAEGETARDLVETTFRDYGYLDRSVHAKSRGFLRSEIGLLGGLPPAHARGLFSRPGRLPVVMRLSGNPGDRPVEDVSVPLPERAGPRLALARITVRRQPAWKEARSRAVGPGMSFSPWHGPAAPRSINRARKPACEMSSGLRASQGGCPLHEPRVAEDIPI